MRYTSVFSDLWLLNLQLPAKLTSGLLSGLHGNFLSFSDSLKFFLIILTFYNSGPE